MNFFKEFKKIIYNMCLYFTAAEFFVLLISAGFSEISPEQGGTVGMFLSLGSSALLLLACLVMSVLNLIWKTEYKKPIKILFHFLGTLVAYSFIFIVIPRAYTSAPQIFARLFVFAVIYLVIAFVVLVISSIKKIKKSERTEYEAQFGSMSKFK